jgi:hypothetical protein
VISPLVANLYINRFLNHWRQSGRGEALQAHVINYADDFVILSRSHAAAALAWTDRVVTRLGLSLNTLNRLMRGWCGYFSPGSHYATDRVVEAHLYDHVRNFLARRHKLPTRGSWQVRIDAVFGTLGVLRPRMCRKAGAMS